MVLLQLLQRRETEKGAIGQLGDLIALDSQDGEWSEAVESESLDRGQPIAVQLSAKTKRSVVTVDVELPSNKKLTSCAEQISAWTAL